MSDVRFAPMIPPDLRDIEHIALFHAAGFYKLEGLGMTSTLPAATAVRTVSAFSDTSTILALPFSLK